MSQPENADLDDEEKLLLRYRDAAVQCLTAMLDEFCNQVDFLATDLDRARLYDMLVALIQTEAATLEDGNVFLDLYATEEESQAMRSRRQEGARAREEKHD